MQLLRGYDADVRKNNGLRRVASEAAGLAGGYDSAAFDVSTQPGPRSMQSIAHRPPGVRSVHYRIVGSIVAGALFMESLDATVLATATTAMAADFHVRAPEMSVALTAYLLALALFIPASGHAADRWGGKNVFRAAIGLFIGASLCCALAPTLPVMALARFVQGIGGAMMVPVGRLVLLRTVSKQQLVAAWSWVLMPGLIGQISGPPIGGFIVTYLHWRWIFWLNLPIGVAGIFLVGRFIPDLHDTVRRPFDLVGLPALRDRPDCGSGRFRKHRTRRATAPGRHLHRSGDSVRSTLCALCGPRTASDPRPLAAAHSHLSAYRSSAVRLRELRRGRIPFCCR
jgi:hypothetical protein